MLVEKRSTETREIVEAAERLLAESAAPRKAARDVKKACEPPHSSCAARNGLGVLARRVACESHESATSLVRVRKFTLRLGAFTSLEDVSFDIAKGKVTALCGPRGCGIAAMLDALGCTLPGARTVDMGGLIELCGHEAYRTLGAERAREKVARVFSAAPSSCRAFAMPSRSPSAREAFTTMPRLLPRSIACCAHSMRKGVWETTSIAQ